MTLAMTTCEICPPHEVEMMISVLLNLFNTRKSLMSLLKAMIEREVAQTGKPIEKTVRPVYLFLTTLL